MEEIVAAEPRVIEPVRPAGQVAAQAAAVAAASAVATVGLAAVVRRRPLRSLRRRRRANRHGLPVVATRSFLVDVHVLDPRR
jgi:hypothetical protein